MKKPSINLVNQKALQRAIERADGQTKLAIELTKRCHSAGLLPKSRKISQSHVHTWVTRNKKGLPAEYCPFVEAITGVPKEALRSDVYGPV